MAFTKLFVRAAVSAALVIQPVHAQSGHAASGYRLWRGDAVLQSHGITIDQMIADFVRKHKLPGITMAHLPDVPAAWSK